MHLKTAVGWLCVFFFLVSISTVYPAETSSEIFNKIQATFDTITTLRASILQANIGLQSQTTTNYSGTIYFQKPDKLRINYTKPAEQQVIYDADYLWIYTPELKQITKQNLNSTSIPIPLFIFAGASNIDRDEFRKKHWIKLIKSDTVGTVTTYRIGIKPKSKAAEFQEISFWFNRATYLPVKAKIIDPTGIIVSLTFSTIEQNITLPANIFSLSVPPEVELVDLTTLNK